jgi:hypothetical protein
LFHCLNPFHKASLGPFLPRPRWLTNKSGGIVNENLSLGSSGHVFIYVQKKILVGRGHFGHCQFLLSAQI